MTTTTATPIPHQTAARIFLRFLRFGLLAWGGPVAQINMLRQELVEEEGWMTPQRFNRVLAVYQVLPGPEAAELCVYFGMLARGRWGGFLAGLGFMLPGFLLILLLSWLYLAVGIQSALLGAVFLGFQPAVAALIVRAVFRIGHHALTNRALLGLGLLAFVAELGGVHFGLTLLTAGLAYGLFQRGRVGWAWAVLGVTFLVVAGFGFGLVGAPTLAGVEGVTASPTGLALFWSGLRAGLLTFGGAYTAIPFLQRDAVQMGGWMTNATFLDGLALSGILPAPLIIFSTFVGYVAGGLGGALAISVGIWLPAFGVTLIGHEFLESLVERRGLHAFLDGVTAGVVGLIAATALTLMLAALGSLLAGFIFAGALLALIRWQHKTTVLYVMLAAGLVGLFSLF